MQKSLMIVTLFVLLVSFAPGKTARPAYFRHIDITFTSQEGCVFHLVGDATFNVLKGKITNFTGTITISGPGGCPGGTYRINYSSFHLTGEEASTYPKEGLMRMEFNTDEVCAISSVNFSTVDGSRETEFACENMNSKGGLKASLIEEIKEGSCK
jgi:hypothetical protein